MKRSAILVASLLAMVGCISTNAVKLTDSSYTPVNPEQVRVFTTEDDVLVPFEKIAIITAEGDSSEKTALIGKMKKKAAELGANGLILGEFKEATTGQKVAKAFLLTSANNKYEATAIHMKTKKHPIREATEEEIR